MSPPLQKPTGRPGSGKDEWASERLPWLGRAVCTFAEFRRFHEAWDELSSQGPRLPLAEKGRSENASESPEGPDGQRACRDGRPGAAGSPPPQQSSSVCTARPCAILSFDGPHILATKKESVGRCAEAHAISSSPCPCPPVCPSEDRSSLNHSSFTSSPWPVKNLQQYCFHGYIVYIWPG